MAKAGRKPLPPGERKIRQHLSLSSDVVEWLDKKNNKSAYIEALIERDIEMNDIRKDVQRIEKEHNVTLSRGAHIGTTDDRLDRWYWEDNDADCVNRRGPGYATKKDAVEAFRETAD